MSMADDGVLVPAIPVARAVGYFRVSGRQQGMLRAELESQRKRLKDYGAAHGLQVIAEFVDYENGNRSAFVQLKKGLDLCKQRDAVLVLPKLGLMIRDWTFLAQLHVADVEVVALDSPALTRSTAGELALVARREDRRLLRAKPQPGGAGLRQG